MEIIDGDGLVSVADVANSRVTQKVAYMNPVNWEDKPNLFCSPSRSLREFVLSDDKTMYVSESYHESIPVSIGNAYIDILFRIEDYHNRIQKLEYALNVFMDERIDETFTIILKIKELQAVLAALKKDENNIFKEYPLIHLLATERYGEFEHAPYHPVPVKPLAPPRGQMFYLNPLNPKVGELKYLNPVDITAESLLQGTSPAFTRERNVEVVQRSSRFNF